MPIVAGPVIDLRRGNVPEWLYMREHDYETLRELVYEHVKNLVTRYRHALWNVDGRQRPACFQQLHALA